MKSATLAAVGMAAILLSGCQTETPYQPRVAGAHQGGYSEQQLDANHWRVRFSGNTATARETVERYLLYRAAELTLQQGADWFEMFDRHTETRSRIEVTPDPFYDSALGRPYGWGWRPHWRYHRPLSGWRDWDAAVGDAIWDDRYDLRQVDRYIATVEISIGKGLPPEGRPVLGAHAVISDLGPGIVRPPS